MIEGSPHSKPFPGKNFLTNPTKKGSGYGYTSLTIGRDYEYISEFIGRPDELRALEKEVRYEKPSQ